MMIQVDGQTVVEEVLGTYIDGVPVAHLVVQWNTIRE